MHGCSLILDVVALQVDATWYGHVHSYSRTCPVYQRNCMGFAPDGTANAPVHLLIDHAGGASSLTSRLLLQSALLPVAVHLGL